MALTQLSRSIAGKVAVVTGAASGMGEATAKLFADEGAQVAAIDLNGGDLARVVGEIEAEGRPVRGWVLDLTDAEAIRGAVRGNRRPLRRHRHSGQQRRHFGADAH